MANFSKRFTGYIIDLVISFLFFLIFFILTGLILSVFDINHSFSIQLKKYLNGISQFQDQFFTYIAFFFFLLLQDIVLKSNSISRRILNLKLADTKDGTYPKLKNLVIRNLIKAFFLLDFVYFIFSKKILHDELSKSTVLKNKINRERN